jgi:hypothetical protein
MAALAGLDLTRFDDLLRGVYDDEQRDAIRRSLDTIRSVGQLRNIVAVAQNVIEATTLLQNSLNGLSYQDAAVLAGLVFPRGNIPSLLPPHNHLNRTTTRTRSRNDSLSLFLACLSSPASLSLFLSFSLSPFGLCLSLTLCLSLLS